MNENDSVKRHQTPVWRARADMTLMMKIDSEDDVPRQEELYARNCGNDLYQICCIPFFIYDLHLGDVVRIVPRDGKNLVEDTVEPSGRHTFRIWFQTFSQSVREDILKEVERLGCLHEWFSEQLLAVDAETDEVAVELANFLETRAAENQLDYETGRTE